MTSKNKPARFKWGKKLKRIFFFLIWVYVFVRVFITDIDIFLIQKIDLNFKLYVTIRFFLILFITLCFWLVQGNKLFWKNIGLFFLFPIYPGFWWWIKLFFWRTPKFLVKNNLHFALYILMEMLIEFFVKFKHVLFKAILLILGFILLFSFQGNIQYVTIGIFFLLQFLHLKKRYNQAYGPVKFLQLELDFLDSNGGKELLKPENIEKQVEKDLKGKKFKPWEKSFKKMEKFVMFSEMASLLCKLPLKPNCLKV